MSGPAHGRSSSIIGHKNKIRRGVTGIGACQKPCDLSPMSAAYMAIPAVQMPPGGQETSASGPRHTREA